MVVTLSNLDEFDGDINAARLEYFNDKSLDGIVGVGKKDKDNGVLIIVSYEERDWGIEVGYGVEGDLTDSESGRIGREVIAPFFADGEYYYGLFIAVASVGEELGYDVEDFDPLFEEEDEPGIIDLLLEDPYFLIYWLLSSGGEFSLIIIILIIVAVIFRSKLGNFGGGGGRSGGGGAKGRW